MDSEIHLGDVHGLESHYADYSWAGPINRDDSFNKVLITALINIQNDISKLN